MQTQRGIVSLLAKWPFVFLLFFQTCLLGWASTRHSPGIDEVGHLAAGLHHWETGRFDLYRVNPPLVRVVATAPLRVIGVSVPEIEFDSRPPKRPEFDLGRALVSRDGERSFWYFTMARWSCLPFSWLVTYVIYRWGRDLYGRHAGLFSASLWTICPTAIANAQMITPDTGACAFGVAACYLFWRWLRAPSWISAFAAGLLLGICELCKTTWLILFAVWPAVWILYYLSDKRNWTEWRSGLAQLASAFFLAVCLLDLGYGFEALGCRLGEFSFTSNALTTEVEPGTRINRFSGSVIGDLPVPLPQNYILGIDVQKRDFELRMWSYLRGEWRTEGWWYYYLYGLLVKTPIGTLVLAGCSVIVWPFIRNPMANWRDECVLLAPGLAIIGFVSSQTGFNHHLRYVLPALPFIFVSIGRLWVYRGRFFLALRLFVVAMACLAAISSLRVYPHSMSYFNEVAGGPLNGGDHLIDSSLDWGQDLLYLKSWYDKHPEARPFGLAYFGFVDPQAAGIAFQLPPPGPDESRDFLAPEATARLGPQPGWYAVSVTLLRGYRYRAPDGQGGMRHVGKPDYDYFLRFKPVDTAGYSIWIYHITEEECARVRALMGMPQTNSVNE